MTCLQVVVNFVVVSQMIRYLTAVTEITENRKCATVVLSFELTRLGPWVQFAKLPLG